ncbi:MAG TPA: hypothetical protein VGC79_19590 [Polyangiaceae bacterium]
MTSREHDYSADERFERMLIDSAASDELPSNVDAAWQKFDAAVKGVSLFAAGSAGALATRRAQRWLATKWLIWGALAGSALTALSLRPSHDDRRAEAVPARSAPIAVPSADSHALQARPEAEAEAPRPEPTTTPAIAAKAKPHPTRTHALPASSEAALSPSSLPAASSTLAAQVALLDAARSAIASGAFAEALRLADRYRADYPNGELSPEAEVVAIEALVARKARQPASERAARFLARYPGDPHAARVKWLAR